MKTIPVFSAKKAILEKAKKSLESMGINCRITRPRRNEGVLRVCPQDAHRARMALMKASRGSVISAAEAAWFNCHACGASLSEGQWHCPKCNATVGDLHGR
jgi:hypothetical protein